MQLSAFKQKSSLLFLIQITDKQQNISGLRPAAVRAAHPGGSWVSSHWHTYTLCKLDGWGMQMIICQHQMGFFSVTCVTAHDIIVWVLGHPIIGVFGQDVMYLGSDCDNLRVRSQSQSTTKKPSFGGSSPCAKEVWAVPLQSRNSYHVDFSKGMHRTVV